MYSLKREQKYFGGMTALSVPYGLPGREFCTDIQTEVLDLNSHIWEFFSNWWWGRKWKVVRGGVQSLKLSVTNSSSLMEIDLSATRFSSAPLCFCASFLRYSSH